MGNVEIINLVLVVFILGLIGGYLLTRQRQPKKVKKHQHVMNCVEYELLKAEDEDRITLIVQENKVEIWKKCEEGDIYTGRHLFR